MSAATTLFTALAVVAADVILFKTNQQETRLLFRQPECGLDVGHIPDSVI
jgi:hypothetical protein